MSMSYQILFIEHHIIGEVDYKSLGTGGVLLVGQEQDIVNGAFDENQAFSGNVTQVEMWKGILFIQDIESLSKCEVDTVDPNNNVVSWKNVDSDWTIHGNVYVVEVSLVSFAKLQTPQATKSAHSS